jgi:hypothetical protein
MKLSKKGRSVYTEVGFWLEKDGSIHLAIKGDPSGHVAVNQGLSGISCAAGRFNMIRPSLG